MSSRAKAALSCGVSIMVVASVLLGLTAGIAQAEPLRIMALGDSITSGYTSWNTVPFTFGYRGPLYTQLKTAGLDFQFVGASTEPWTPAHIYQDGSWYTSQNAPTNIAAPDLRTVDTVNQDGHRGYWGQRTDWVLSNTGTQGNINNWLASDDPDVVLLMLGTNNLDLDTSGTTEPTTSEAQLNTLVQTIINSSPTIKVIVSTITPRTKTNLTSGAPIKYNNYIKNTLIPHFQNDLGLGDRVTMVDQFANFINPNGSLKTSFLADSVHPNVAGYAALAQTWATAIKQPEPSTLCLLGSFGLLLAVRGYWRLRRRKI